MTIPKGICGIFVQDVIQKKQKGIGNFTDFDDYLRQSKYTVRDRA